MAGRGAEKDQPPEADQRDGARHPRQMAVLFGHQSAEEHFYRGLCSGDMAHAWLVSGPEGVGKATLCYRVARRALSLGGRESLGSGASPGEGEYDGDVLGSGALSGEGEYDGLTMSPSHPVFRQVANAAHPDLFILRREAASSGSGKLRSVISVDDVRRATRFVMRTAAGGGWRVCIVDNADALNRAAANALLKTLEEPPKRCLFLLVAHRVGALPATLRSRCHRLVLSRLGEADMLRALAASLSEDSLSALSDAQRHDLLALAKGCPGRAAELLARGGLAMADELTLLLASLPRIDKARLHEFLTKYAGGSLAANTSHLTMILELIEDFIASKIEACASSSAEAARWGDASLEIRRAWQQTEIYNFDRRAALFAIFNRLSGV